MNPFNSKKPFNELPLLPPEIKLETPLILKACIEAHKELARLKIAESLIPNQTVLINSIPLLESQASSAIENIVTTTDELFEHFQDKGDHISSAIKETLQYRQALYQGFLSLQKRPFCISTVCEIYTTLRQVETEVRKLPGTILMNEASRKKIYTPPEGKDRLRNLLTNWQEYIHRKDDIDPLIKLAVQHYQFEAIHPFHDRNGRTGRVINLLYLIEKGLLNTPVLYLSGYITKHKTQYYEKLLKVTSEGAWLDWILYFLRAVTETSRWTTEKIFAIRSLIEESCIFIKKHAPYIYSKELIDLLFTQPYTRIHNIVEAKIGGRDKLFINHQFLTLLKQK